MPTLDQIPQENWHLCLGGGRLLLGFRDTSKGGHRSSIGIYRDIVPFGGSILGFPCLRQTTACL